MEQSDASSVSAASSSVDLVEHNVWNPMLFLFPVQIGGIFELFVEERYLARIALFFHFVLVLLCGKAETHDPA